MDDLDDFDILSEPNISTLLPSPPKRPGRKGKAASAEPQALKPKTRKRGAVAPEVADERMEIPETQQEPAVQSKLARTASTATKQPKPAKREPIPETQPEPMEVDETVAPISEPERIEDSVSKPYVHAHKTSFTTGRQRHAPSSALKAGSDTERGGNDPSLRRKVGDLTKKLEALEVKYNNVRDLSMTDAESAFDKLKRQSDEKSIGKCSIPLLSMWHVC